MLKNKLILGIIISLFSNFAFAQPSNTCLEAADKLIEINRIENLLKSQTDMMTNYLATNLELSADEKQELNKLMTDILDIKSLKQDMVIAYCNTFSEDEINEMIAFNQTPLGQKISNKLPELQYQLMSNMAVNFEQRANEVIKFNQSSLGQRARDKMPELEQKLKSDKKFQKLIGKIKP